MSSLFLFLLLLSAPSASVRLLELSKTVEESGFLFLRRTITQPPFWVSLHRPADDTPRAKIMDTGMYYEEDKTRHIMGFMSKTPGIFLDVGANIGWYSLAAAAVGSSVLAVEANPVNAIRLQQAIRVNNFGPSITLHHGGAGANVSTLWFVSVETNMGMGHFVTSPEPKAIRVPVHPVDYIVESLPSSKREMPVVCVKVDVEGFEAEVILGMMGTLRRFKPILFLEFDNRPPSTEYLRAMHGIFSVGYSMQEGRTTLRSSTSLLEFTKWFHEVVVPKSHPSDVIFKQPHHSV